MNNGVYFARFAIENGDAEIRWQLLKDHLNSVAQLAAQYADQAGADGDFIHAARFAGFLHDIGKYGAFQDRIRLLAIHGQAPPVRHAYFGALIAFHRMREAAFAIMGHHSGLPDYADLDLAARNESLLSSIEALLSNQEMRRECPWLSAFEHCGRVDSAAGSRMDVRTRILLSCLVDADRIDSARFEYGDDVCRATPFDAMALLAKLERSMQQLRSGKPDSPLNRLRNDIFRFCLDNGSRPGSLFSLTVPTGGGKTLSSMAFALSRAASFPNDIRRIIVVIPYLSIIEQNARIYREIFGPEVVLEHHSGDLQEEMRADETAHGINESLTSVPTTTGHSLAILRENWDAPIIVTTSVRFFESLFSNRPGDLRRAHNIARSLVILDEVQTFPPQLLEPILSMIGELSHEWKTTFLFCTATQPAFEKQPDSFSDDRRWRSGTIIPVLPADFTRDLFQKLRRVKDPAWPQSDKKKNWDELADEILRHDRVLCIVNTRRHAARLYQEILEKTPETTRRTGTLFHLSTRLCPRHRLKLLNTIRDRLALAAEPCIVISTQLVEAGVDIDFPVVYRAFGPFDAMIQAAGRCNREGTLNSIDGEPGGEFHIFHPVEDESPYPYAVGTTRMMFSQGVPSLHEPGHVTYYFNQLYAGSDLDPKSVEALRAQLCFASVARRFRMIDDTGTGVLVPYDDEARHLIAALRSGKKPDREMLRKLQQFTVSLNKGELKSGTECGAIRELIPGSGILLLAEDYYSDQLGVYFAD